MEKPHRSQVLLSTMTKGLSPPQGQAVRWVRSKAWSGLRMLRGALSVTPRVRKTWKHRFEALEGVEVVSTDVFNTLLFQDPDLECTISAAVCRKALDLLNEAGTSRPAEPDEIRATLGEIRSRLKAAAGTRPERPEVPRREVYRSLFQHLACGTDPDCLANELLKFEIDLHTRLTGPNPEMRDFLAHVRSTGRPILALSDTYLGSAEVQHLLWRHGITEVGRIYASCEHAADKFHGALFNKVLMEQGLTARRLLHVGDSRMGDVWSAREKGIPAIRYRSRPFPTVAALTGCDDPTFCVGYSSLGPVFAAFCHLLLVEARRRGLGRLAFVARDGDLLREATARLISGAPFSEAPKLQYVYFSRCSTALPAAKRLDREAIQTALNIRAGGTPVERVLGYFGIPKEALPEDLAVALERGDSFEEFGDPRFRHVVERQVREQTVLLADYLRQEDLFSSPSVALVDVGWRATIQRTVNCAFAQDPRFQALPGLYLGLWSDSGKDRPLGAPACGLLGDRSRGSNIFEAAPWHLALVLEPLCRASHGTVLGYRRNEDRTVSPVLAGRTAAREAEIAREALVSGLRQGILAYMEAYAKGLSADPSLLPALRRKAQRRLLRLAFFPDRREVEVLGSLIHTESHAANWSRPLVALDRPSPWTAPRRWLAGCSSPWRGGYVAATGGRAFSMAYFCVESLLAASPFFNAKVQTWARRVAGI